jgi:iron complex outermembrane receptor protein
MSTIPSAMIDRIEVLKDGASSIYGSDAISGVVNIILKKNLEGAQLSLYTGANDKLDGRNKDFSISYGANADKASLMFGFSHTEQGAVWARDRPITSTPRGPNHPTAGLGVGPWGEVLDTNQSDFDLVLNHTGGAGGNGVGVGADPRNPANYHAYSGDASDNFNSASQMMFLLPNKLDTLFTKGTIDLPYDMQFSTTAMYSQRSSTAQIAGYPLNSESQPSFPVYIDRNNYYNTFGQDLYFYRRTTEVPRVTENENRTLHIDATLSGNFDVRGHTFNWDVGGARQRDEHRQCQFAEPEKRPRSFVPECEWRRAVRHARRASRAGHMRAIQYRRRPERLDPCRAGLYHVDRPGHLRQHHQQRHREYQR